MSQDMRTLLRRRSNERGIFLQVKATEPPGSAPNSFAAFVDAPQSEPQSSLSFVNRPARKSRYICSIRWSSARHERAVVNRGLVLSRASVEENSRLLRGADAKVAHRALVAPIEPTDLTLAERCTFVVHEDRATDGQEEAVIGGRQLLLEDCARRK